MIAVSKGETIEHYVSRRISGVPGGACSAALSKRSSCAARWRQWPPGRVSFRPGWANAGGLCLSKSSCGRHTDRRAAPTEFTLGQNVSSKEEVDEVMKQASKAGAVVVKDAHDTFYGGYSGYFQDPDSHLWEIAWNPAWEVRE